MRQLEVSYLQLGALARQDRPILAPIELEGITVLKGQRHEDATPSGLLRDLSLCLPLPHEGGHTTIGTIVAQGYEVGVQ